MNSVFAFVIAGLGVAWVSAPAAAQTAGAAGIEQVPSSGATGPRAGLRPVDPSRPSATVQSATAEKVPPLVSARTLAACQAAQAADRPAPAGVDCVKALQVAAAEAQAAAAPSAEGSLLTMFGQSATVTTRPSDGNDQSVNADQVSRRLSSGELVGAGGNDAAAIVARDRGSPSSAPPPQSAPPPR